MRDKNRIKTFLERLEKVWNKVPDWRFGQLMSNVLDLRENDPFYIEDDEIIKSIENYFKEV